MSGIAATAAALFGRAESNARRKIGLSGNGRPTLLLVDVSSPLMLIVASVILRGERWTGATLMPRI